MLLRGGPVVCICGSIVCRESSLMGQAGGEAGKCNIHITGGAFGRLDLWTEGAWFKATKRDKAVPWNRPVVPLPHRPDPQKQEEGRPTLFGSTLSLLKSIAHSRVRVLADERRQRQRSSPPPPDTTSSATSHPDSP